MRLWFKRGRNDAETPRKEQHRATRRQAHAQKPARPPDDDPIKNWETRDQKFLREAGDPFDS